MLRAKTEKRPVRLWTFLTLLVVILVVLIFAERARLPVGSAAKPTAGYLYFLSSGQMSDTSNQGIADQVSLKVSPVRPPAAGESYYAWLLPDQNAPENPLFLLGTLTLHGDEGSLFYNNPEHTNLLAFTSQLLVTEENSVVPPLSPSLNTEDWRYQAIIPQQVPPGQTYSFRDHLRHLLASDPKLQAYHLPGGLIPWLTRNIQAAYAQATNARDAWQGNRTSSITLIRHDLMALLYYLAGASNAQQELPTILPPDALSLESKAVSIGLLQIDAQQDPPAYLNHVLLHLNGLFSSAGTTPSERTQISQIITTIETINVWLQQAHQDVKQLVAMTDQQLQQPQATFLLNDLATKISYALAGRRDAVTGNVEQGVQWVIQVATDLASVEITRYPAQDHADETSRF